MARAVMYLAVLAVAACRLVMSFECPQQSTQSLIVDPDDCRKYYHCLPDGRVFPMQCPKGLVFHPRQKICIWDSNAKSCAPNHELEVIKSWQPKQSSTKEKNSQANKSVRETQSKASRKNKGQKQKKSLSFNTRKNIHQNSKGKSVPTKRPRNDWFRKRRTTSTTTTTTTTQTPTTTSTVPTTTTTTIAPRTWPESAFGGIEMVKDEATSDQGRIKEPSYLDDILTKLGFQEKNSQPLDREAESVETAPVTDKLYDLLASRGQTADVYEAGEGLAQPQTASHTYHQQPHSLHKRSPEDNMVWDSVQCPSGYAYIPDPSNCATFYHCYNWQPMKKRCPHGLFYDHKTYVCNWPHNVNCIEGYRAKSLYRYKEMRRDNVNGNRLATTRAPKKNVKKLWQRPAPKLKTTKTTTTTTTTTSPMARQTTVLRKVLPSASVELPSPQRFRNKVELQGVSDGSAYITDVPDNLKSSIDHEKYPSAIYTRSPNQRDHQASSSKQYSKQGFRPHYDSNTIVEAAYQPTTQEPNLSENIQHSENRGLATGPQKQSRGNYFNSSNRLQNQISGSSLNKPLPDSTDQLHNFSLSPTTDHLHRLHDNAVVPEPYASNVENNNQKSDEPDTKPSPETATAESATATVHGSTYSGTGKATTNTTTTVAHFSKINTDRTTVKTTNSTQFSPIDTTMKMDTEADKTANVTNNNATPESLVHSTSVTTKVIVNKTSTSDSKLSTVSLSSMTSTSSAFSETTTSASTSTTQQSPERTGTVQTSSNAPANSPIAYTAARIPFYATKSLHDETGTSKDSLTVSIDTYRRGNSLRAVSPSTGDHDMHASPSMYTSVSAEPERSNPTYNSGGDVSKAHDDQPEAVRIQKFMVNLLNDAVKTKHIVSRDTSNETTHSQNRTFVSYELTTSKVQDKNSTMSTKLDDKVQSDNTQPTLLLEANTEESFLTTMSVNGLSHKDEINTDTTVFASNPTDFISSDVLQNDELLISKPRIAPFSGIKLPKDDSDNMIAMTSVTDKDSDQQQPDKYGVKSNNSDRSMSRKGEAKEEEVEYSGDADSDWDIPKIQVFSALAGYKDDGISQLDPTTDKDSEKLEKLAKETFAPEVKSVKDEVLVDEAQTESKPEKQTMNITSTLQSSSTANSSAEKTAETATQKPLPNTSSTGYINTTEEKTTTIAVAMQTSPCKTVNCSSNQFQTEKLNGSLNTANTSGDTTPSASATSPGSTKMTAVNTTTTTKANITATPTVKAEAYVAKEILTDKGLEKPHENNSLTFDNNKDTSIPRGDSNNLSISGMKNELDSVEPKETKKTGESVSRTHPESVTTFSEKDNATNFDSANPKIPVNSTTSSKDEFIKRSSERELINKTVLLSNVNRTTLPGHMKTFGSSDNETENTHTDGSDDSMKEAENLGNSQTSVPTPPSLSSEITTSESSTQTENVTMKTSTTSQPGNSSTITQPKADNLTSLNSSAASKEQSLLNKDIATTNNGGSAATRPETSTTSEPSTAKISQSLVVLSESKDLQETHKTLSSSPETTPSQRKVTTTTQNTASGTPVHTTSTTNNTTANTSKPVHTTSSQTNDGSEGLSGSQITLTEPNDNVNSSLAESDVMPVAYISGDAGLESQNVMDVEKGDRPDVDDTHKAGMSNTLVTSSSSFFKNKTGNASQHTNNSSQATPTLSATTEATPISEDSANTTRAAAMTTNDTADVHSFSTSSNSFSPSVTSNSTTSLISFTTTTTFTSDEQKRGQKETTAGAELTEKQTKNRQNTPVSEAGSRLNEHEITGQPDLQSSAPIVVTEPSSTQPQVTDNDSKSRSTQQTIEGGENTQQPEQETPEIGQFYTGTEVTTASQTTSSKRSFVSLTDLITWYLKHWRNYSKWKQGQTTFSTTVAF